MSKRLSWSGGVLVILQGCSIYPETKAESLYDPDGDGVWVGDDCNNDDPNVGELRWYIDRDGDGYGTDSDVLDQCGQQLGYVDNSSDCNDDNDTVNPEMSEYCDGEDNDCNGAVDDDALDAFEYWLDNDGDLYGDSSVVVKSCEEDLDGAVVADAAASDCDDFSAQTNPQASELCDDADNDCDGTVDEDPIDPATWYADEDGDSYGDEDATERACDAPSGYVDNGDDCDDAADDVHPGASETYYDGIDQDCSGGTDNDADSDGYESSDYGGTDCDDFSSAVSPALDEVCGDALDNNCDGVAYPCAFEGEYLCDEATGLCVYTGDDPTLSTASHSGAVLEGLAADDDSLGVQLVGAGDLTGDGTSDMLMGASGTSTLAGRVYLVHAMSSAAGAGGGEVDPYAFRFTGGEDLALVGSAMDGSADLNDDGYVDLVIGAPGATTPLDEYFGGGVVYVVEGPVTASDSGDTYGEVSLTRTTIPAIGGYDSDIYFGAGLLVGAASEFDDGAATVFVRDIGALWALDEPTSWSRTSSELLELGTQISMTSSRSSDLGRSLTKTDMNGDGLVEVLVGDAGNNRVAVLCDGVSAASGEVALEEVATGYLAVTGLSTQGRYLRNLGDLDGDGVEDLATTSYSSTDNASVVIFSGVDADAACSGATVDEATLRITGLYSLGTSSGWLPDMAGGQDLDQSGALDLIVSAPDASSSAGNAYLYYDIGAYLALGGTRSKERADVRFEGPEGSNFGRSVLMAPNFMTDTDMDSSSPDITEAAGSEIPDLVISAPKTDAGRVFLLPGNGM